MPRLTEAARFCLGISFRALPRLAAQDIRCPESATVRVLEKDNCLPRKAVATVLMVSSVSENGQHIPS